MVVVVTQFADVHQAFNIDVVQLDKQSEAGNRGNGTYKLITNTVLHVLALQRIDDAIASGISATLSGRTVLAELDHVFQIIGVDILSGQVRRTAVLLRMGAGLTANQRTNCTMHQQVRITTYRGSEMRVGLEAKTKVA